MTLAARFAEQTIRNHGRDPWKVAARLGLRVKRVALPDPHRELYAQRGGPTGRAGLAISRAANDDEAKELLAHGIAHHLMHAGDRVSGGSRAVWSGRHEREADDFAALLLIPDRCLRQLAGSDPQTDVAELCEWCGVSPALAKRRIGLTCLLD